MKRRYERMTEKKLPRFVMCFCTGECPGFGKLDLWPLINFVRNELDVEYAVIHPQLCVEDGDRFFADYLDANDKDRVYIVGGCDPIMQWKMFKEAFKAKGLDIKKQLIPLDLRNMPTEEAMKKVQEAVEQALGEQKA
jgi:heterodisulfide reductase subunit A-like polyferredoxin